MSTRIRFAISFTLGLVAGFALHYFFYRMGLPASPFIYQVF